MAKFSLTMRAIADLVDIARYTEKHWGPEQRNKYLTILDSAFRQLAATPAKGRDCSDIRHGYRKMNIGSHVVFYRQKQSDEIEIVRVLHERMDIETKIFSAED
jgi:toxin ParE1/3/4